MLIPSLRRAFREALHQRLSAAVMATVGFAISFSIIYLIEGEAAALGEIKVWVISSIGAVIFIIVLFLWNLILAPYRIMREKCIFLEEELKSHGRSDALERLKRQDSFPLWDAACIIAGQPSNRNPHGEASAYLYILKKDLLELHKNGEIDKLLNDQFADQGKAFAGMARFLSIERQIDMVSDVNTIDRENLLKIIKNHRPEFFDQIVSFDRKKKVSI